MRMRSYQIALNNIVPETNQTDLRPIKVIKIHFFSAKFRSIDSSLTEYALWTRMLISSCNALHHILKIGTRKPWCGTSEDFWINIYTYCHRSQRHCKVWEHAPFPTMIPCKWCCTICTRPRTSGNGTAIILSKRPGRTRALWKMDSIGDY